MKKILFGLSSAALAFLVACASEPASKQTGTAAAVAAIDVNLAHLRTLTVFEVGKLVERIPEGAANCYSLPCNDADAARIAAAHAEQAVRLDRLTEAAARAIGATPQATSCDPEIIDVNLSHLRGLGIVEVGKLLVEQPKTSANCYNLACPADVEAAHKVTCERAADLAAIVSATRGM